MATIVELRRHTDNDGDVLSVDGVRAAVDLGRRLGHDYDLVVSSGAQRATQAAACILAGLGRAVPAGVIVDDGFRSEDEHRWRQAAGKADPKTMDGFREVDPELVRTDGERFADAIRRVLGHLPEGGRALVVGHSPMHEAAVHALTGEVLGSIGKGAGVVLTCEGDDCTVEEVGAEG